MSAPTESSPSLPSITERTPIKTDLKTVGVVLGAIVLAVYAWANLKTDVAAHTLQLSRIQETQAADHDILLELRGVLRGERRAAGSTPNATLSRQP